MRYRRVEDRMTEWAMCKSYARHEAGRPSESLEYRMMTLGQVAGGGFVGDGGMVREVCQHHADIAAAQRALEINKILRRMRYADIDACRVLIRAFRTRPGFILPAGVGAQRASVSRSTWINRYQRGLAFVHGALDDVAGMYNA